MAQNYPEFTRSSLERLFDDGYVTISKRAIKPSHKLIAGEKVSVDEKVLRKKPPAIKLPVIYEDEDVIVMDKPPGVLTHAKGALNLEATVASYIKDKITDPKLGGNRAGIIHRLDRATSGVIITAKNETAQRWLQKQFSTRKANKTYLAIVEGVPAQLEAIIDAPVERNPKRPQTFRVGGAGKPAQTRYRVLKKLNRPAPHQNLSGAVGNRIAKRQVLGAGSSNLYSLLELNPRTGRTHQLRVHLKYIGHPIVGDNVYGHGDDNMYLHAKSLEITLPGGQRKKFEARMPKIFKEIK